MADGVEAAQEVRRRAHLGPDLDLPDDESDAAGQIDWTVPVDSTINRAHQRATDTTRQGQDTGGDVESQEPEPRGHQQWTRMSRHRPVPWRGDEQDSPRRRRARPTARRRRHSGPVARRASAGGRSGGHLGAARRCGQAEVDALAVLAEKAYSSRGNRAMLRRRGIQVVIPEPSDQQANRKWRGSIGGRPPKLDRETYKRRNVVERSFNLLKQWRGLATRYDKHTVTYRAGAVLAVIITWLRS